MTRKALALGALLALLACGTARASDDFHITAGGDQNWGPSSGGLNQQGPTKLEADGTMHGDLNASGTVNYNLQAGPGIARASMSGEFTVPSGLAYPFNPSVQAVATTELTVNGPAFELNTSLNLHVDGIIRASVCGGDAPSCGSLNVFIFAPSGTTAGAGSELFADGSSRENELGLTYDRIPGGYHVHGDVTSRPFGLRSGTPTPIGIVLNLSGRFAGHPQKSTFGGSFADPKQRWQVSFAPAGPVLNVPAGYTVSGNAVVSNRWDDPFSDDLVVSNCQDPALANLTTIAGNLVLRCDGAAFPNLTHIAGDIVFDGNHAPHVAFPGPVTVDGSVRVVGTDGGDLDLGDGSVGGAIDVSGNGGDLTIDAGSVGGAIDASGNGGDLTIDTGFVGGAIDVSGTGGDLTIDTGSVGGAIDASGTGGDLTIDAGSVGGDLDISDNPDADAIDIGGGSVGGDLTIIDNGTAVVDANDSLTISGDANVETDGGGMVDLSNVEAGGDETVTADGADGVSANTAGGTTDISILGGTAAMHVVLTDGAFDRPVAFTITPRGDDPAQDGVDPVAGYTFAFAVPTLDADARLSFTIDLATLDPATRAAVLGDSATIATKPDAPGSAYTAFARCAGAQTPEANGCVAVRLLAADGSAAPVGTDPAFARFDGIAGHFSTYAVALVAQPQAAPPGNGGPPAGPASPPPAGSTPGATAAHPTTAQIRARLRSQIVPAGQAGRIGALLTHGYRLRFQALTAGTAKIAWYRPRKGRRPLLIASGRHRFAAAGRATIRVKLTAAGRRQLRRAKQLRLTAKGTFTPAPAAPVTAARRFTLRR